MKENKYNTEKIIKELDKKHFIAINMICDKCLLNIISIIVYSFPWAHIEYDCDTDESNLYTLRVTI